MAKTHNIDSTNAVSNLIISWERNTLAQAGRLGNACIHRKENHPYIVWKYQPKVEIWADE